VACAAAAAASWEVGNPGESSEQTLGAQIPHLMRPHLMRRIGAMRTTLEIDDDVLEAAKCLARQTERTAGAVLSDLARRALTSVAAKSTRASVGGFVPFESRGGLVTNEQIDRLRDQDVY
jgi:Arc/MetJ family transcription regulator